MALANVTFAPHWPVVLPCVMFAGQVIDGACVSLTVMLKEQVDELLDASVARNVTVVVPTEKDEPDAGPAI